MTDIPYVSMCGIAGIIRAGGEPVARRDVEAMTAALLHRGPDGRGAHVDGSVGLGHTRLAIIDPSPDADQPMASDDEQVWIVFNGEIYDFQRHRRTLEARGRRFRTRSDTEVILHAYLEWGDDFIDRLDGMFAIAIYDRRRQSVKLYRDRPANREKFLLMKYDEAKKAVQEAFQKEFVTNLLSSCDGRISKAAVKSGLSRQALYKLIKKHGIRARNHHAPQIT